MATLLPLYFWYSFLNPSGRTQKGHGTCLKSRLGKANLCLPRPRHFQTQDCDKGRLLCGNWVSQGSWCLIQTYANSLEFQPIPIHSNPFQSQNLVVKCVYNQLNLHCSMIFPWPPWLFRLFGPCHFSVVMTSRSRVIFGCRAAWGATACRLPAAPRRASRWRKKSAETRTHSAPELHSPPALKRRTPLKHLMSVGNGKNVH